MRNGMEEDLEDRLRRLEAVVAGVEKLDDDGARRSAVAAIQALLQLHGDGLARILELTRDAGEPGAALVAAMTADRLVGGLLLLHGLHPVPQEQRVSEALDRVRPYLGSHGGDVELLSAAGGVVRLRLRGSCHGCPSSSQTLEHAIEHAIREAAPDVASIEVDGGTEPVPGFVPLSRIRADVPRRWLPVPGLESLPAGGLRSAEVGGTRLVCCRLGSGWYAYLDGCPGCRGSLAAGSLDSTLLACPACGRRYDVRAAGRCQDAPDLHLEPLPLLVEGGVIRVAAG
jgi:Fe-S cluster biogenesis protein NfuA/nitrite reductase/ring-hydroxylating ferredoxin subunit